MKNDNRDTEEADVVRLISKLRQEKLYVKSEKKCIHELNELIKTKTDKALKLAWITNKQRLLLYQREVSPQNSEQLEVIGNSEFVDAKNNLGFQNFLKVSSLLQILRSQPKQLARWLVEGDNVQEDGFQFSLVLQSIVNGLYGSFLFNEDTKFVLNLLLELAKLQFLKSENPRRMIQHKTCSFLTLYSLFNEVSHSSKFFLNAALEIPILQVLSYTDHILDIEPDKTITGFKDEVLNVYKDAIEYRNEVIMRLAEFTNNFLLSILENVYSFPKSLAWIAFQISKSIEKTLGPKEANAIVTQLIFTSFICPVILDPEQYGICNCQVTEVSRHNLIQVGNILQRLALLKFESVDKKYVDVFNLLDKNSMSNFIELLFFDMESSEPPVESSPAISRSIMLFTEQELNNLITFLQKVHLNMIRSDNIDNVSALSVSIEEQLASLSLSGSRDSSPKMARPSSDTGEYSLKKSTFFALGMKSSSSRPSSGEPKTSQAILVFPLDSSNVEPIGLLSEEKVIDLSVPIKNEEIFRDVVADVKEKNVPPISETVTQNGEIKTNFSNYIDEGSIGNTSDNLEAISEAASNHSVASSLELENEDQNDNLSDMVSANVSGRGTPNISGRDTPSSQVNENEDRACVENRPENAPPPQPQSISRQAEIDDKFCKFEIKKLIEGDETISIISETWSTDVLASDNETIDNNESRNERHGLHLLDQAIQEVPIGNLDISETQSESAWSTDVMTSDTERLTEVDNDDAGSVAQSDDTNSVARSDDTRSETDEAASFRRLSTSSNSYVSPSNQNYVTSVSVNNTSYVNVTSNSPSYVSSNTNFLTNTANFVSINQNYVTSASFQEIRKVDLKSEKMNGKVCTGLGTQTDNNANTVFKSLVDTQFPNGVSYSEIKTSSFSSSSNVTTLVNNRVTFSNKSDNVAGPSGLGKSSMDDSEAYMKQNRNKKKFGDRPNEILLSNCSLNSSSSGSSSNSFENKNSGNENSEQWENKQWLNSSGSSLNVTLTPSESTSELSVLSVNNLINPVNANAKKSSTLLNNRSLKPSVSTGAIPKSISFDTSIDKGLDDDHRSKRGGFFGKLRNGFKVKRGKVMRHQEEYRADDDFGINKRVNESPLKLSNASDTSEDILAKYRPKPFLESSPIKDNCLVKPHKERNGELQESETNSFIDIKKKLRLALSHTSEIPYYIKLNPSSIRVKLETILRLELGKARKLRDWSAVARISEAIRCIHLLNDKNSVKLFQSMREDIVMRSTYIQYLVNSKEELLFCDMYLNSLDEQLAHDKYLCETYFATICVKEFIAEQNAIVSEFVDEFKQLSLADEKCDFLQKFYHKLFAIMNASPMWHSVLQQREPVIKITLERYIISKVYLNALYPNGDGDRARDQVLREHIAKLSKIITPDHKDLMIPKTYLRESPWLPAQDALRALDACRTPRDKVTCVMHCAKCIMDLLSLSQGKGSTTADDFTPVLVYVIIKVNPEALMSTIQFVSSFQGQLFGEEEYWWTQFCAAVEYIKTMDYSD